MAHKPRPIGGWRCSMRIYLAGASGVIGSRLVPLLLSARHTVGAMKRSAEKAGRLASIGAQPIVCDVFDRPALTSAVRGFSPDVLMYELTDLPDDLENLPADSLLNARIRVEGTRNILDALEGLGQTKIVAQSVAWRHPRTDQIPELPTHKRIPRRTHHNPSTRGCCNQPLKPPRKSVTEHDTRHRETRNYEHLRVPLRRRPRRALHAPGPAVRRT